MRDMIDSTKGIPPGTRVMAFDWRLYKNDRDTPLSTTVRPATVICHYGRMATSYGNELVLGPYPNCIDVEFDHNPGVVSVGHFVAEITASPDSVNTK